MIPVFKELTFKDWGLKSHAGMQAYIMRLSLRLQDFQGHQIWPNETEGPDLMYNFI